jgi:nicotinamide riboside transporter PnuC
MLELIGLLSMVIAVAGVWLNNHRLRVCFVLWWVSNLTSCGLHVALGCWSLALRDALFFALAIHGFLCWGRKVTRDK